MRTAWRAGSKLLAVNATSVFLGTKLAAAEMAKTGGGSIVNISSIMGIVASAESHPGYPASKAAVRNYTKAAACRYGPQGVRVNSVHPGYMPPMLNATNAAGRAGKDRADAAAPAGRADRGGVWRAVPGVRRGVVRHRRRAGDRRRLHRAVARRASEREVADDPATDRQIPGVYHRRIGDIVVTALSDGYLDGTVDVLQNITPDEAMRMLTETFRPGRRTSVNCYADPLGRAAGADRDRLGRLPAADRRQAAGEPGGRRDRSGGRSRR